MPGNAMTAASGGTLNIFGDIVSSGSISIAGSASVTGDVYARCQSSIPGVTTACFPSGSSTPCTYPDTAGVTRSGYNFIDPKYPPPPVVGDHLDSNGDLQRPVLRPRKRAINLLLGEDQR